MLKEKLSKITEFIRLQNQFIEYNKKLIKAYRGDLLSIVKEDVFSKFQSTQSKIDCENMAISINIIPQIVDSISIAYSLPVERIANNPNNQEGVDFYIKKFNINKKLQKTLSFFTTTKASGIELYINSKGGIDARSCSNDCFLVYTDDQIEPNMPKVYIKFLGCVLKELEENKYKEVNKYQLWTEDEVLTIDEDGTIDETEYAKNNGENILGTIPFVYLNEDDDLLLPIQRKDLLQNNLQVCNVATSGNVALHYQGNPIRVIINANMKKSNINIAPHSVVVLNSDDDGKTVDFKELPSSLNTDNCLNFMKTIIELTLASYGLTAQAVLNEASSGLELRLKSGDLIAIREKQIEFLKPFESELWKKVAIIHNNWLVNQNADIKELWKGGFDEDFEVQAIFSSPEVIATGNNENKDTVDSKVANSDLAGNTVDDATKDEESDVGSDDDSNVKDIKSGAKPNQPNDATSSKPKPKVEGQVEVKEDATKEVSTDKVNTETPEVGTTSAPTENVQAQALNGAQVASLVEIVEKVAMGTLPRDAAVNIIVLAFNVLPQDAEKILGGAGKSFKIKGEGDGKPTESTSDGSKGV